MAVVVRTTQMIGDRERSGIATYLSTRPVGPAQRDQAQRLDAELATRMRLVTEQVQAAGWLALKGRAGVVRLWWEVGTRLRDFVDNLDVGPHEDRQFIWRAMYDHAPDLIPGRIGSRAERLQNSHFNYCYRLGKFPWVKVKAFGDWTSWVEVFDSDRIRTDDRIAEWLVERATSDDPEWKRFTDRSRMAWFRPLAREIRATFSNRDSTGLTHAELQAELDAAFDRVRVST